MIPTPPVCADVEDTAVGDCEDAVDGVGVGDTLSRPDGCNETEESVCVSREQLILLQTADETLADMKLEADSEDSAF